MTETKFTPGPWVVSRKFVVGPQDKEDGQSFGMVVGVSDVYGENRSADAHLIAAAPELYEVLVRMKEWCEDEVGAGLPCDSINAALAKARGETND